MENFLNSHLVTQIQKFTELQSLHSEKNVTENNKIGKEMEERRALAKKMKIEELQCQPCVDYGDETVAMQVRARLIFSNILLGSGSGVRIRLCMCIDIFNLFQEFHVFKGFSRS